MTPTTSIDPFAAKLDRVGPLADLRHGVEQLVDLVEPAPADCTVLNNCDSCCTGSNKFDSSRMKAAITPIESLPRWTSHPPTPITAAEAAMPQNSTSPKYQVETRTECMWASYSERLEATKRRTCSGSRA